MVAPLAATPAGVDIQAWEAACAAVRAYCGWHIAPTVAETVTLDGSGGRVMLLPTLRLTELTSITNNGTAVTDPEWSTKGVVRGCWTSKFRGVTAEMVHGYDECPPEVVQVLMDMATVSATVGAATMTAGPFQYAPTSAASQGGRVGISEQQAARLAPYKLPPRP